MMMPSTESMVRRGWIRRASKPTLTLAVMATRFMPGLQRRRSRIEYWRGGCTPPTNARFRSRRSFETYREIWMKTRRPRPEPCRRIWSPAGFAPSARGTRGGRSVLPPTRGSSMPLARTRIWGGRPQALHVAIETNRPAMVKLLLRHGADVDGSNDGYLHWSPLLLTPGRRSGHPPDAAPPGRQADLTDALATGDDRRALALLKRGTASAASRGAERREPARLRADPRAIDRLLALGVSIDETDRWGAAPMDAFSRLGPPGKRLVRHLAARASRPARKCSPGSPTGKRSSSWIRRSSGGPRCSRPRSTSGITLWPRGSSIRGPIERPGRRRGGRNTAPQRRLERRCQDGGAAARARGKSHDPGPEVSRDPGRLGGDGRGGDQQPRLRPDRESPNAARTAVIRAGR